MYYFTSIYNLRSTLSESWNGDTEAAASGLWGCYPNRRNSGAVTPSALTNGTAVLRFTRIHASLTLTYTTQSQMKRYGLREVITARRVLSNLSTQDNVINSLWGYPRWLVGYSDLTALHAVWNLGEHIRDTFPSGIGIDVQRHGGYRGKGNVSGKFLGGNLSVLVGMVGSGLLPNYQGAILFIEDAGEVAYRLDRMLLRSEEFSGIVGIAIVQLLEGDTDGYTALELLDRTLAPLGLPIGHDTAIAMPMALGADAEIDVEAESLLISF
ncbi:uncharacterized protein ARMOST_10909 [Armillaria ostoyae]|uniref:LD-carboxypeptidase C-terminal domain-containing protein n=1 Tax=Armillaria ostoyae TaxID=47428 RepID=A0A284RFM5_ARMOS|nr:uncharacterized protein ARMOST_10909 [Armillaria ostoyae]